MSIQENAGLHDHLEYLTLVHSSPAWEEEAVLGGFPALVCICCKASYLEAVPVSAAGEE
mgnify:CR=1 FL=1